MFSLFLCQVPRGKPAALSHTPSTPAALRSQRLPHSLPTPCHCQRRVFSAGSDNESDEEVTGKKSFSAQVFSLLAPTQLSEGATQSRVGAGWGPGLSVRQGVDQDRQSECQVELYEGIAGPGPSGRCGM